MSTVPLHGDTTTRLVLFCYLSPRDSTLFFPHRQLTKKHSAPNKQIENPAGAKMRKIGDWTDPKKSFPTGAVGFRSSGGEHMRYDNVLVYDIGDNPHASGTAVDPHGKLAATWASLKTNR